MAGKVHAALRLLTNDSKGGLLSLDDQLDGDPLGMTVREALKAKQPDPQPPHPDTILPDSHQLPEVHPVFFDCIDGEAIRNAVLRCSGSAGLSGVDATGWRRFFSAFRGASKELCNSMAKLC